MPSALNALPTITTTALGGGLGTSDAAGQYKAPTAVVGLQVPMDSLNFYVQAQDSTILNVVATATSTQNSPDQTVTQHRGANWFLNIGTVAATCTLGINLQYKDPASGNYITVQRASVDGTNGGSLFQFSNYPGQNTANGNAGILAVWANPPLSTTYRIQVSVTATASGGGAAATFTIGQSKVL